jgi:hypothetical protein
MTEQNTHNNDDHKDSEHEHRHPELEPPGRIIHPRPSHGDA